MMGTGERQEAFSLAGIRPDHKHRYAWAAERLGGKSVVDAACGVGYGSKILAEKKCTIRAYDRDEGAIAHARQHFNHTPNIEYSVGDLYRVTFPDMADAVICFEALEHLVSPEKALRRFRDMAPLLLASVPNEEVLPFRGYRHHVRHYTKDQFAELLTKNGWKPVEWWGQKDEYAPVERDVNGRTLVVVAERADAPEVKDTPSSLATPEEILGGPVPGSVAIVALGSSRTQYSVECSKHWSRKAAFDETWAINAMGGQIQFDRMFHQDDIRIQERRAAAGHKGIANMLAWMKDCEQPIYTSRAHPDYRATVDYPLEWVLNRTGRVPYINSTLAAALVFAIACRVPELGIYGGDFGYAHRNSKAEQGRGCVEFWMGVALMNGTTFRDNPITTLMDANHNPRERVYGYDTEWLSFEQDDDTGRIKVAREDRKPEDIPGAVEMNLRYSHDPDLERLAKLQPRGT